MDIAYGVALHLFAGAAGEGLLTRPHVREVCATMVSVVCAAAVKRKGDRRGLADDGRMSLRWSRRSGVDERCGGGGMNDGCIGGCVRGELEQCRDGVVDV